MKKTINWKLYFILLAISVICIVAVLPYAFTLASAMLKQVTVPFPIIVTVSILQSTILFAVILFFGLLLSKKVGLGLPIIEKYIFKKSGPLNTKSIVKTSIFLGIVTGIVIVLFDFIFTKLGVGISLWTGQMPPHWMGFLASFYGGIGEEILLRLFFMTFLVWLFSIFRKSKKNILENNYIMWTSIILATILFGLGHLPITQSVTTLTPLVIIRALALNGIGGIVFGRLYWKKGLESAMIAHFSADIILQVIFPLILSVVMTTL